MEQLRQLYQLQKQAPDAHELYQDAVAFYSNSLLGSSGSEAEKNLVSLVKRRDSSHGDLGPYIVMLEAISAAFDPRPNSGVCPLVQPVECDFIINRDGFVSAKESESEHEDANILALQVVLTTNRLPTAASVIAVKFIMSGSGPQLKLSQSSPKPKKLLPKPNEESNSSADRIVPILPPEARLIALVQGRLPQFCTATQGDVSAVCKRLSDLRPLIEQDCPPIGALTLLVPDNGAGARSITTYPRCVKVVSRGVESFFADPDQSVLTMLTSMARHLSLQPISRRGPNKF